MRRNGAGASQRSTARLAGFMFLFGLFYPTLNWVLVRARLGVPGDAAATAASSMANQRLFRIAIANGVVVAVGVIVMSVALYALLRRENDSLALLALSLRLVEAALIVLIGMLEYIAFRALEAKEYLAAFTSEQVRVPVGSLIELNMDLWGAFPMLFLGLGLTVFSYLFFESGYLPRAVAGLGMLSYGLIFVHAVMMILAPGLATTGIIRAICWAPSCLFELAAGTLLLVRGVDVGPHDAPALPAA